MNNEIALAIITQAGKVQYPAIKDDLVWETERNLSPAKLTFTALKDNLLNFQEGDAVQLKVNGVNVFKGVIFVKERDKNQQIKVTAYDQIRYMKNKISFIHDGKTASEILRQIASMYQINTGTIDDTGYTLSPHVDDGVSMLDIVLNALDDTFRINKKSFLLYDKYGAVCLENTDKFILNGPIIDADALGNFSYKTSIDEDTYNRIYMVYDNEETGIREIYPKQNDKLVNKWGVLSYYHKVKTKNGMAEMASKFLELKGRKTRQIRLTDILGDINVRAGCSIPVTLNLGDVVANEHFLCERVVQRINSDIILMDIELLDSNKWGVKS